MCSNSQSSCWTWLAFFIFQEKSDGSDQVAGLGLQIEILYLSSVCSNSQSSCWTWLVFFVFKEKSDRYDQVAGLGPQIEILYLSSVCSNSQSNCWTWLFFLFLKRKVTDMIKLLDLVSKLKFCICHQCAQIVSQVAGLGLLFRF